MKNFTVGLAVDPAPWGLDVRWTSLDRSAGVPGPAAHPSPEARREDALDGLRADVRYKSGSGWDLKTGVFTRSQELRFTDPAPPVVDPLVATTAIARRQEDSSTGVDAQLNFDTKSGEIFTVGAEWVDDRVDGLGDEDHAAQRWSLYTQDQWRQRRLVGGRGAPPRRALRVRREDEPLALGGLGERRLEALGRVGQEFPHAELRRSLPGRAVPQGQPRSRAGDLRELRRRHRDGGRLGARAVERVPAQRQEPDQSGPTPTATSSISPRTLRRRRSAAGRLKHCTARARPSRSPSAISGSRLRTKRRAKAYPARCTGSGGRRSRPPGPSSTWSLEYAVTDRGEYRQREGGLELLPSSTRLSGGGT